MSLIHQQRSLVKPAPLTRSLEPRHLELLWIGLAEPASKVWEKIKKMFSQNICTTAYDNCYGIDLTKDNYKTAWCRKKMLLVWLWLIHLLVDTDSTWPKIIKSQAQLRQDNHLTPSESLTATSTSRIAQQNSGVHCGDLSQKARIIGLPASPGDTHTWGLGTKQSNPSWRRSNAIPSEETWLMD